jgi:hypothetical protein
MVSAMASESSLRFDSGDRAQASLGLIAAPAQPLPSDAFTIFCETKLQEQHPELRDLISAGQPADQQAITKLAELWDSGTMLSYSELSPEIRDILDSEKRVFREEYLLTFPFKMPGERKTPLPLAPCIISYNSESGEDDLSDKESDYDDDEEFVFPRIDDLRSRNGGGCLRS